MCSLKVLLALVYLLFSLSFSSCGQTKTATNSQDVDSVAVMQAFENLKTDRPFLKDLGLEDEHYYQFSDFILQPIFGDLDDDGITDALVAFSVEGRSGGNHSDLHYAVFLKKGNQWAYQSQFNANAGSPDLFYGFKTIENGVITGAIMDNEEVLPDIPVEYEFKNGELINTFTALHKTENEEREYLRIENIITPTGKIIPPTGTLQTYEQALGKGRFSTPKQQPECGTYFEEGTYREWLYEHNLRLELSDNKKAAWRSIFMRGTDYKVNTDKGTITANTTVEELKNIFFKEDSWQISDADGGGKTFSIPDGFESDNQLQISFSKDGKLEGIYLFIPC